MTEKQQKVRPALTGLEIGATVTFPISRTKTVRAQASDLGLILDRVYKTTTNREAKTITVTRTA